MQFANAAGPAVLHPDLSGAPDPAALAVWSARGAAPLLLQGAALAALRGRLLARAQVLGWRATAFARPTVLADDAALPARAAGEGAWRVAVHSSIRRLRLRSHSFVPAEVQPGSGDTRRLGLAVRALRLDGADLPGDAYAAGWHPAEAGWRWSDGCGEILLPARSRRVVLELSAAPAGPYWAPPRGDAPGRTAAMPA
jgi:hypothetical protein